MINEQKHRFSMKLPAKTRNSRWHQTNSRVLEYRRQGETFLWGKARRSSWNCLRISCQVLQSFIWSMHIGGNNLRQVDQRKACRYVNKSLSERRLLDRLAAPGCSTNHFHLSYLGNKPFGSWIDLRIQITHCLKTCGHSSDTALFAGRNPHLKVTAQFNGFEHTSPKKQYVQRCLQTLPASLQDYRTGFPSDWCHDLSLDCLV